MVLLAGSASADIWISTTHHEGDTPLNVATARGFVDGNELWNQCDKNADSYPHIMCMAYIVGVADVYSNQTANNMCLPKNATEEQLADVVTKYLRQHPEERHYTAQSDVLVALAEAFPCNRS